MSFSVNAKRVAGQEMEDFWYIGPCMAAQEYDFNISYQKGTANTNNADALSHKQTSITEQSAATYFLRAIATT